MSERYAKGDGMDRGRRIAIVILLALLFSSCGDDEGQQHFVCGIDVPCIQVLFATLKDGDIVGTANDLDRDVFGVQYNVRVKMTDPLPGGTLALTRNHHQVSITAVALGPETREVTFREYTLQMGENLLRATLTTSDGDIVDSVEITIWVE